MSKTGSAALMGFAMLCAGCGLGTAQLRSEEGKLADCDFRRCVSSLEPGAARRIEPIRYSGSQDAARAALLRIIGDTDGARLVTQRWDYLLVEFQSPILRYVDDLELVFAAREKLVHVRSSSRLGLYDFAKNRERVETLRERFEALQP